MSMAIYAKRGGETDKIARPQPHELAEALVLVHGVVVGHDALSVSGSLKRRGVSCGDGVPRAGQVADRNARTSAEH